MSNNRVHTTVILTLLSQAYCSGENRKSVARSDTAKADAAPQRGATGETSLSRKPVKVVVEKPDGSSSISTIRVAAFSPSRLTDVQVNDIVASLVIETYPDEIVLDVAPTRTSNYFNDGNVFWYLDFDVSSMKSEWVAVRVLPLPAYAELANLKQMLLAKDGTFLARFFTGSDLRLLSIQACSKRPGEYGFMMQMSERIASDDATASASARFATSNQELPCRGAVVDSVVAFYCSGVDDSVEIRVDIFPGLRAANGADLLGDGNQLPYRFVIASLPEGNIGCRLFPVW